MTAHRAVTTQLLVTTFRTAISKHGAPASTLTDNGMIFTVRLAGHRREGGRKRSNTNSPASASSRRTAHPPTRKPKAKSNGSNRP